MDKDNKLKAYGAGIAFSIFVGFSFLGVKICVPLADTLEILTHRYNFAMLAVIIVMVLGIWKVDLKGKPKRDLLLTASFYIGFMILQVIGLFFATSIESAIIFAIIPIIAKIIAGIFLGEKAGILQNLFVCLSVAALIFMIVMGATRLTINPIGITMLFLSSVSMAISNVFMRYVRAEYKPFEITAAICLEGFIIFNAATLVRGLATGTLDQYFAPFESTEFIIATAYLGTFCILFSAQMMSYMLANLEAVKATIFGNVSTAISIVAGVVVLGESLQIYHIICTALIIVGVIGVSMTGEKAKPKEALDDKV